eukprot:CAMPEP_0117697550 /NCGR_PEP_ID=MMETSP0804-20121206/29296_1 /TAXON_ID=1074897 /ORGANISM="Tetraselmis astigmatica, Strain CCMP880" /LENGTH=394 /DNA_ID=CAMNT_0005511823 /DNA_START=429 /DNA_END=1613 /DNA_ORIENTATION=+
MSSCGGQVVFPKGFLTDLCEEMRAVGAICVSDEVQVGFGRLGSAFWGFQAMGVFPEIVTMGKGIGNGFPVAAVVTTARIATAFANGMEYFNTTGGCNAACAAALAVLDVIKEEKLQENAAAVGGHLLEGFQALAEQSPVLGDVRGSGLFLGLEVVMDKQAKVPAPHVADWIVAACMTAHSVLLSTDGPHDNVIKLKPPMCFSLSDANDLLEALGEVILQQLPPRLLGLLAHDHTAADTRAANAALKRRLQEALGLSATDAQKLVDQGQLMPRPSGGQGEPSEGCPVGGQHDNGGGQGGRSGGHGGPSNSSTRLQAAGATGNVTAVGSLVLKEGTQPLSGREAAATQPPPAATSAAAPCCLPSSWNWAAAAVAVAGLAFCCGAGLGMRLGASRQR